MNYQIIIDQQSEEIKQLKDENKQHLSDKNKLQCLLDTSNRRCEMLEFQLSCKQSIIDRNDQEKKDILDAFSKSRTLVNISGQVTVSGEDLGIGSCNRTTDTEETPLAKEADAILTENTPPTHPSASSETFFDRVKAIIRLAATKNGQRVESRAKGHVSFYTYYIDADCFCKALDELAQNEPKRLIDYLGGKKDNVQVSKVCFFLGHVLRLKIINDAYLQMKDVLFAFEKYYPNRTTLTGKLSDKDVSPELDDIIGDFKELLKSHKR